jgi:hypothetical protein
MKGYPTAYGLISHSFVSFIASFLINLSQAVGRLILTGRDLTRFAGYTVSTEHTLHQSIECPFLPYGLVFIKSRVAELFDVLADVRAGKYTRTLVSEEDGNSLESQGRRMCFMHDDHSLAFFFEPPLW